MFYAWNSVKYIFFNSKHSRNFATWGDSNCNGFIATFGHCKDDFRKFNGHKWEETTFINCNILAVGCRDQNQEQAFQIHTVNAYKTFFSQLSQCGEVIFSSYQVKICPNFPYSVSKRGWGDGFSFGKHSADLSGQRSLRSRASDRKGCPLPSTARGDQLSQMQTGEQRAGFIGPQPTGPCAGGAPFQCLAHGLCGIKAF